MENSKTFLKTERRQTDESLVSERGKTDESFGDHKKRAEDETDMTVKSDRQEADQSRQQRRMNVDMKTPADGTAQSERQHEDEAIKVERRSVDEALDHERDSKEKAFEKIFEQERMATDKNLRHERSETDMEVRRGTELLNAEQNAHEETKTNLTTREELVAIVSHDLRNPIGAVASSAELLFEEPAFQALGETPKKLLSIIQRNANDALRLIADLLDMERLAHGRLDLNLMKDSVSKIAGQSVENLAHAASDKGLRLSSIPARADSEIFFDKDRILQVLSNLIGNALKFTPAGGSITVETKVLPQEIEVSVKDTGPGIAKDQQKRIFERFAQLGSNNRMGLGLGLYISKEMIEAHGGKLWLDSTAGNGSTFYFTLPLETVT